MILTLFTDKNAPGKNVQYLKNNFKKVVAFSNRHFQILNNIFQ